MVRCRGDKVEVIQALSRLRSLGRLWATYDGEMAAAGVGPVDRVRRTVFYELGGAITARDLKPQGGRLVGHVWGTWAVWEIDYAHCERATAKAGRQSQSTCDLLFANK
jgi:hypothetical protein